MKPALTLLAIAAVLAVSFAQVPIGTGTGTGGGSSSSSSGGATSLSGVTDFALTRTSGTVMTINGAASASAPVNARIGATVYSFTGSATVTLSGTACSAAQYWYVANDGAITMGHNASTCTYTGSGVTVATPITGYPTDSIPLWTTSTTTGAWDTLVGAMDKRSPNSKAPNFIAGTNVTLTEAAGSLTINASGGSSAFDVTTPGNYFYRWVSNGFNISGIWTYNNCATSNGVIGNSTVDFSASYGSDTTNGCFFGYPGQSIKLPDFTQGTYTAAVRGGRHNTSAQDIYYGVENTISGAPADFVGPRWTHGSTIFQCVIRSGGTDRATATLTGTNDTNLHWFYTSNNATANSVTCQIDGNTAVTITNATFPTFSDPRIGGQSAAGTGQVKHSEGFIKITGRVM